MPVCIPFYRFYVHTYSRTVFVFSTQRRKMKSQMAWAVAVALLSVLFAYGLEASANSVDAPVRIITAV